MIYYIYDGSFEGLLTSIYEAYYRKDNPLKILSINNYQRELLVEYIHIETVPEKAEKVYNSIRKKISVKTLQNVFYVYLSEFDDIGTLIYQYLRYGWKIGRNVDLHISDDRVSTIHNIRRKVTREIHFMLGLLRFKELKNNIYYAEYEPDYNITALIAPHFIERLSDQNWVIHDIKRGIGVLYNQKEWAVKDINLESDLEFSKDEIFYQRLWIKYFDSIAIKNRINPKLQKSNMPMKYWKYLVEK
ncbi:MAG: DNA metabolism protein [Firmicutes bacterium]|nr:DNA metabolism protein [Bacillota bacterium]